MGSVVSLYAGQVVSDVWSILHDKPRKVQENLHKNLLAFNATHSIDIPPPYDNLSNYNVTLAHKANHAFKSNARWGTINHPRYMYYSNLRLTPQHDEEKPNCKKNLHRFEIWGLVANVVSPTNLKKI